MKKVIALFLIFTIGCNTHEKIHIKEQSIKELSSFNFNLPSPDIALYLFVRSSDDHHLARLNIIALHKIYTAAYSQYNDSFETFLSDVLNETKSIDDEILIKKGGYEFQLNEKIKHDYRSLKLSDFKNKYCEKRIYGQFAIKKEFKNAENLHSILYYFFINNYKVVPDDYSGQYVVIPPSS